LRFKEKTIPHLSPTLQDVVMMQRHTGMRSGEILRLTLDQVEDGVYRPRKHKTQRHGHAREIPLGPRAMEIIARREPGADGLLFGGYTSCSYGRAITRACEKHGIPHWTPHQIRHARGTDTLRTHGVAAARALLGHKSLAMVSRYAAVDVNDAKKAVSEDG
jgi:integrase